MKTVYNVVDIFTLIDLMHYELNKKIPKFT